MNRYLEAGETLHGHLGELNDLANAARMARKLAAAPELARSAAVAVAHRDVRKESASAKARAGRRAFAATAPFWS